MEIHLIPDKTAIVQFVIFALVLVVLSYFVFKPITKIIRLRKEKTEKLLEEVKKIEDHIKKNSETYATEIRAAKSAAEQEKEKIRRAGLVEEGKIRELSKKESFEIMERARIKIATEKEKAIEELKKDLPKLADEIVKKVKS